MPGQRIARSVKESAMRALDRAETTIDQIARTGIISRRTVQRVRREWLANGGRLNDESPVERRGRPRKMSSSSCRLLRSLHRRDTALRLDELQAELASRGHGLIGLSTISKQLKFMGMSRKKMTIYASQRSPEDRFEFLLRIGQYPPEYLVFTDESGVDNGSTRRVYGRSLRGKRAYKSYKLGKGTRYNVLPGCALGSGPFATMIHEGKFKGDDFYLYLRDYLLPQMGPYPGPRSVLVCDNAAVHKLPCIIDLVETAGCRIEFLPTYSPDYNPIEKVFSKMKAVLKRRGRTTFMKRRIHAALAEVTAQDVEGYFRFSNYVGKDE